MRNQAKVAAVLITFLGAFLPSIVLGQEGADSSSKWCETYERWRGTALLSEARYDFYCSGVSEINVESSPERDVRFFEDNLSYSFALQLVDGERDNNSILYTAFMLPSTKGCNERSVQRTWATEGDGERIGRVNISCTMTQPGEYTLYLRSGNASLRIPVFVPPSLPSRAEYEAAERAKRSRVEVMSVTAGESRSYGGRFTITIRNNHTLAIDIIRFRVHPKDRWGTAITRCGYYGGWHEFWGFERAKDGSTIRLTSEEACWSGLSELGVGIIRVKFVDGSVWTP